MFCRRRHGLSFVCWYDYQLAGAFLAFLLAKYGYIPNQEQTQLVKTVIFSTQTLLIIIGSLLSIIVMLFYPLTEVMHQKITLKQKSEQEV